MHWTTGKTGVGCKNHQADDKLSVSAENCATRFLDLRYRPDSTEKNDLCVKILFAKYVMTIKTQTLLTKLFGQCKSLGIVKSQYEFSRLCGRRQSWYSASKCRNAQISTEAAAACLAISSRTLRKNSAVIFACRPSTSAALLAVTSKAKYSSKRNWIFYLFYNALCLSRYRS